MSAFLSLTYDDVKRYVGFLPDGAIAELVQGPLPDLKPGDPGYTTGDDCRVCRALEPLSSSGPAGALLDWHDFTSKSFDMVRLIAKAGTAAIGDNERQLTEECQAMIGGLSYARCLTIYGLAEAEAGIRRRRLEAAA
ncbi:MAG TPA: hypothetical protein VFN92_13375 [Solirubrobacterales bacterium]|nr:hypothetical protein [Solirubrobacterales bacterium]